MSCHLYGDAGRHECKGRQPNSAVGTAQAGRISGLFNLLNLVVMDKMQSRQREKVQDGIITVLFTILAFILTVMVINVANAMGMN